MPSDYRPRFSFDITDLQQERCDKLISTHGMRKALGQPILDDLLDLLEKHGQIVAGIIMSKKAKPKDIMPLLKSTERRVER